MERNRSEGWTHAKISGHKNEELICKEIRRGNSSIKKMKSNEISECKIGGLSEHNVTCILGNSTKSKTDLIITWDDSTKTNISIKKSCGGQVFLIRTSRFISGYEHHYGKIEDRIKNGLMIYFGEHKDIEKIITQTHKNVTDSKIRNYQQRKKRLVWDSLKSYDIDTANSLLNWFKKNISNITDFCFSKGLVADSNDWAEYIWYKNSVNESDIDQLYKIEELKKRCDNNNAMIHPGCKMGGSTIQLPFGFVQWHQGQMQFHHKFYDIEALFKE